MQHGTAWLHLLALLIKKIIEKKFNQAHFKFVFSFLLFFVRKFVYVLIETERLIRQNKTKEKRPSEGRRERSLLGPSSHMESNSKGKAFKSPPGGGCFTLKPYF